MHWIKGFLFLINYKLTELNSYLELNTTVLLTLYFLSATVVEFEYYILVLEKYFLARYPI